MQSIEIGLLRTALILLDEQHVTRAAERLHLSVSATSRALDRCRRAFGDELLVRQGRNLVITARGEALRERIRPLLDEIESLATERPFDPRGLRASFTIRANEAVIAGGGASLLTRARSEAPHVELRFEFEAADDIDALRNGAADLAIGSFSSVPPDITAAPLLVEHLVGALRGDHPLVGQTITPRRFAALEHIVVSRRGIRQGPIDALLAERHLQRSPPIVLPSFAAALAFAAQGDQCAIVPSRLATVFSRGGGLHLFEIPLPLPTVPISQYWHHRLSSDPAHMWLRSCVERAVPAERPDTTSSD